MFNATAGRGKTIHLATEMISITGRARAVTVCGSEGRGNTGQLYAVRRTSQDVTCKRCLTR